MSGSGPRRSGRASFVRVLRSTSVVAEIWTGFHVVDPRLDRPSNQKPTLYPRTNGMIGARAPVAQWIERRPPEPSRLSVVATRVGLRAKRVEFYALTLRSRPEFASGAPTRVPILVERTARS